MRANYLFCALFLSFTLFSIVEVNKFSSSQLQNREEEKIEKPVVQKQLQKKKESELTKSKTPLVTKKEITLAKKQKKECQSAQKTITVKNEITTEMLSYKHWSGTHKPTFKLSVNGKEIEQGNQEKITVQDNQLDIRYDYSFANGFRTGATIVSCQLDKNADAVDITFSWQDEWRIKTKQAQPQKIETAAYSA